MISHLKETFELVYSAPLPENYRPKYKVTPISEPYPYTDAKISVNTFDDPIQPVTVKVYNVGGGRLTVERISIPHAHSRWMERKVRPKPVTLTASSDPLLVELNILLRDLPTFTNKNIAKLKLITKPQRKTFTDITLEVRPPDDKAVNLSLPEYINFGEITACKISINREVFDKPSVDFFLIGNFTNNPLTSFEITQKDENVFDAKMTTANDSWHYRLDLRKPGMVKPRLKPNSNEVNLKSLQQSFQIANVNKKGFSGQVKTSEMDWLVCPNLINVAGYRTVNLSMSVKVEKLKQGRNFGEIVISDKTIPVWTWLKVVNETVLTLNSNQPKFHHIEELSEQERPLALDIVPVDQSLQTLMIFEDLDFHFPLASEDQIGYLMGDFNNWTPHSLFFEKQEGYFETKLSVSDGTYLYRAEIDGEMRLDPIRLNELICCSHGIASKMQINRSEQKLILHKKTKKNLNLKLQSSTEWMQTDLDEIALIGSSKQEINLLFKPQHLQPGLNLGWIQFETIKEPTRSFHSPIYVMGKTNGAVPKLKNTVLTYPEIQQGQSEEIPFVIDIIGKGELKGEVQPSNVLRFMDGNLQIQNENAFEPKEIEKLLQVVTDRPSNAYRKQIQASLITDCYLANRRVHRFKANYDMIHLFTDPPALYFPKVFLFDKPKQTDLVVKRSDGKDIEECHVKIPDEIEQNGLLKVENTDGHCRFELNPQVDTDTGRISDTIHLMDHKSGMTLPIQFAAELVGGQAEINVNTESHNTNQSSNGPQLVVTNIGKTELKIFDIDFKLSRFYIEPYFTTEQWILLPGQSIERQIRIKNTIGSFGKSTVNDTIIIRLNDPQYPKGVYEKDIVVKNHKSLLKFRR